MKVGLIQDIDHSNGTITAIDVKTGIPFEAFFVRFLAADCGDFAVFKPLEDCFVILHVMNSVFRVEIPEFSADVISLEHFRETGKIKKVA